MQLRLLKMESGTYAESSSTLLPIEEEETQLSPVLSEINYGSEVDNWKYPYAVDVLIYSGFEDSNFDIFRTTWHCPDCPLDPKLFDFLEKKYNNNDETTSPSRSERKLLFDQINATLLETVDFRPWVMPELTGLNQKCVKEDVRDAIEKIINEEFSNNEITDKELDREMMWSDSKEVIEMLGNEMEALLIDDMIIEVLCM